MPKKEFRYRSFADAARLENRGSRPRKISLALAEALREKAEREAKEERDVREEREAKIAQEAAGENNGELASNNMSWVHLQSQLNFIPNDNQDYDDHDDDDNKNTTLSAEEIFIEYKDSVAAINNQLRHKVEEEYNALVAKLPSHCQLCIEGFVSSPSSPSSASLSSSSDTVTVTVVTFYACHKVEIPVCQFCKQAVVRPFALRCLPATKNSWSINSIDRRVSAQWISLKVVEFMDALEAKTYLSLHSFTAALLSSYISPPELTVATIQRKLHAALRLYQQLEELKQQYIAQLAPSLPSGE